MSGGGRLEMARVGLEGVGAVLRWGLVAGRRLGWGREVAGVGLEGVWLVAPSLEFLELVFGAVEFLGQLRVACPEGFFFRFVACYFSVCATICVVCVIGNPASSLGALLDQPRRRLPYPLRAPRPLLEDPQPIHLPPLPLSSLQDHILLRNLHLLAPRQLKPEVLQPAPIQDRHGVSTRPCLLVAARGGVKRADEQRPFDPAFLPCRARGVEGVEHGVGREGEDGGCGGVVAAQDKEVELGVGACGRWGGGGRGVGGVGGMVAVLGFVGVEGFGGGAVGEGSGVRGVSGFASRHCVERGRVS